MATYPVEQPRCRLCGHRRIFHTRLSGHGRTLGGAKRVEEMVPCSLNDCDCPEYRTRPQPGQSAPAPRAGNRPQLVP